MNETITLLSAQRKLSVVWLVGAAAVVLVVVMQALNGFYADTSNVPIVDNTIDAFQWAFSTVAPTSTLIVGVLATTEMNSAVKRVFAKQRRSVFFLNMTLCVCISYLAFAMLFPAFATVKTTAADRALVLKYSGFVLPIIQGLVSVALAAFFYKLEDAEPEGGVSPSNKATPKSDATESDPA